MNKDDRYYKRAYADSTYRTYKSKLKKLLNATIVDFCRDGYGFLVVYDKNKKRYSEWVAFAKFREQ